MKQNEWIENRIKTIATLKNPTQAQQLMLTLGRLENRTPEQEKKLLAIVKAEQSAEKAAIARAKLNKMLNADRTAEAKAAKAARDHEMYEAAGLLSLAGLVDKKTGIPIWDRATLLGALMALSNLPSDDSRRAQYQTRGSVRLAEAAAARKALSTA